MLVIEGKLFAKLRTCKIDERDIDEVAGIESLSATNDRESLAILNFSLLEHIIRDKNKN